MLLSQICVILTCQLPNRVSKTSASANMYFFGYSYLTLPESSLLNNVKQCAFESQLLLGSSGSFDKNHEQGCSVSWEVLSKSSTYTDGLSEAQVFFVYFDGETNSMNCLACYCISS